MVIASGTIIQTSSRTTDGPEEGPPRDGLCRFRLCHEARCLRGRKHLSPARVMGGGEHAIRVAWPYLM